jgi:hypothetical protein
MMRGFVRAEETETRGNLVSPARERFVWRASWQHARLAFSAATLMILASVAAGRPVRPR